MYGGLKLRTEAQKKANKKYDSLHYKVISGKAKIQDVEQYKKKAAKYSITMSMLITNCINYCINNNIDISGSIKLNQSGADTISDIQDDIADK